MPRRHGRLAFAILALLVLIPATAAEARFTESDKTRSVRIAYRFWLDVSPQQVKREGFDCRPGKVRIDWRRDMGRAMASADLYGCSHPRPKIRLERPTFIRLEDDHACAVITHEFGHLLGYGHVKDRHNVMTGSPTSSGERAPHRATWNRVYTRCRRALGLR